MMKKRFMVLIIAILFTTCVPALAEDAAAPLPWGMQWNVSLEGYIAAMQQAIPNVEYDIQEYEGLSPNSEYTVRGWLPGTDPDIYQYNAYFSGEALSTPEALAAEPVMHTLAEMQGLPSQLYFLNMTVSQSSYPHGTEEEKRAMYQGEVITVFQEAYQQFEQEFGAAQDSYSYIAENSEVSYSVPYLIPKKDGRIDFDAIKAHFVSRIQTDGVRTYSVFLGNQQATCYFDVSSMINGDGILSENWFIIYSFSSEEFVQTPDEAKALPQP